MKAEDLIIASVDDHIVEPPHLWDAHLSAQHKHLAPKMLRDESGADFWVFEGRRAAQGGLNAVVGRPPEEYGMEPISLDEMRKGVWDIDARIDDMNVNGILASINFPSILTFDGGLFLGFENKENAKILLSAYNDWHIDEWCAKYPGRNIPNAIVPYWDIDATVAEIERVAKKGCHAISFCDFTNAHHSAWTHAKTNFGNKKPSEVFREHFLTCFIEDKFGLANLEAIGEDFVAYECDYPHSDTQWPYVPEHLFETVKHLTDSQIDKVTHLNAMKFYNFDAFGMMGGRENCTVKALRAKAAHVSTEPMTQSGAAPLKAGEQPRRVTSGDIVAMFASVNAKDQERVDA